MALPGQIKLLCDNLLLRFQAHLFLKRLQRAEHWLGMLSLGFTAPSGHKLPAVRTGHFICLSCSALWGWRCLEPFAVLRAQEFLS